jgi:hypothetical protein
MVVDHAVAEARSSVSRSHGARLSLGAGDASPTKKKKKKTPPPSGSGKAAAVPDLRASLSSLSSLSSTASRPSTSQPVRASLRSEANIATLNDIIAKMRRT